MMFMVNIPRDKQIDIPELQNLFYIGFNNMAGQLDDQPIESRFDLPSQFTTQLINRLTEMLVQKIADMPVLYDGNDDIGVSVR